MSTADKANAEAEKKAKAALKELTIEGRITKTEKKNKKGKTRTSYVLTDAEGKKINLPTPKAPKKKKKDAEPAPAINLDDYVDVDVKVVGKGTETEKKDKKIIKLKEITSIEKIAEDKPAE